ncbi:MAG: MFS transporter [Acidimicrobiia bacterium]
MDRDRVQRRTVAALMVSNSVGYAGLVSVVAVAGLLASEVMGRDLLAGLPAAAATMGTALAATPLALRSKRRGRRRGLWLGYFIGAAGGALALAAGQAGVFWLLIVAMAVFGVAQASNLQARFAAADLADPERRARAISMVVWVGTVGAVLGPPAALWANRVGTAELGLGSWVAPMLLGILGFSVAGLVIVLALRPDPLVLAGGVDPHAERENPLRTASRAWTAVWNNSRARLALVVMAVSQMAMVAVMTMTPLHMRDHGHAELSTLVISVHVLGMFGLSPLIGGWADRFGRIRSVGAGAAILGLGTIATVIAGYIPLMLFVGLFLLGLGWSFALIAGSALLTESLPIEERVGAQGLADVSMSSLAALAAFFSGFVKEAAGYHWLANFATIAAIVMIVAVMQVRRAELEPAI